MKRFLAFDLGASSGRAILATLENGKITMREVHRFANNGVNVRGTFYWDVLYLWNEIKQGMVKARLAGGFDFVGIDTWGVDFGLLDKNGDLISNPVHYRDSRTDNIPDELFYTVSRERLYDRTGIQIISFNTLFQLFYLAQYRRDLLDRAETMLFMPDLLNYFMTGEKRSEYTIASTSQMLNPYTRGWDFELLGEVGIPKRILCGIIPAGTKIGRISDEVCTELGIEGADVIAVGSHDTASAVVSVPTDKKDFVYISCGTWSLFGTELDEPLVCAEGMAASYTNEGGFGKKIRYLTNIMGLWLIQESRRAWAKKGEEYSFNDLEQAARGCAAFRCFIDPDSPEFGKPGDIPARVADFCRRTGQYVPGTVGEIVRCIYESLAMKYRYAFLNLASLTGRSFDGIHIVGGGTRDPFLCAMCADACNTEVSAGPVEATALGNIAVQMIAAGEIANLTEARKIIADSSDIKKYTPQNPSEWDKAYKNFTEILVK